MPGPLEGVQTAEHNLDELTHHRHDDENFSFFSSLFTPRGEKYGQHDNGEHFNGVHIGVHAGHKGRAHLLVAGAAVVPLGGGIFSTCLLQVQIRINELQRVPGQRVQEVAWLYRDVLQFGQPFE